MKKLLVLLPFLFTVLTISVKAAEPARYHADSGSLFIPEVIIDGEIYIRGVLNLKSNGEYHVSNLGMGIK